MQDELYTYVIVRFEPDYEFGLTAIATQYIPKNERKHLRSFPLWQPKEGF